MGLACYCLLLACFCLPLACYCLPLVCYCLSLTAYPSLLLPLTRLLTTSAYPLACYCLPFTRAACRRCPCYCTHVCCGQDCLPTESRYGIAFAIADPCRIRDCLHMLTRHVNVHALITPAPGSIPRLSQPPLQKRPSVATLAAHLSIYCSFPVSARSWLAHML